MTDATHANGRRIHMDYTIRLSDLVGWSMLILAGGIAYGSLNSRVEQIVKDVGRIDKVADSKAGRDELGRAEVDLSRRIVEQRQYINETQTVTAQNIADIKSMIRDLGNNIERQLDRKADKPGR